MTYDEKYAENNVKFSIDRFQEFQSYSGQSLKGEDKCLHLGCFVFIEKKIIFFNILQEDIDEEPQHRLGRRVKTKKNFFFF